MDDTDPGWRVVRGASTNKKKKERKKKSRENSNSIVDGTTNTLRSRLIYEFVLLPRVSTGIEFLSSFAIVYPLFSFFFVFSRFLTHEIFDGALEIERVKRAKKKYLKKKNTYIYICAYINKGIYEGREIEFYDILRLLLTCKIQSENK